MAEPKSPTLVAVIMGSASDWETMRHSVETLNELGIANEHHVLSAHRTPDATADFARKAASTRSGVNGDSCRRTPTAS